MILLDIVDPDLSSFGALEGSLDKGQTVGIGQQQAHGLDIARIAKFAQLGGKPLSVDCLPQQRG
jgi:hypothetical protein